MYAKTEQYKIKIKNIERNIKNVILNKKTVVSYSTGKDSLVMLDIAIKQKNDIGIMFHNSWYELPESYEIIKKAQKHYKKDIVQVKSPIDILKQYKKKKAFLKGGCKAFAFNEAMMIPIRLFQQKQNYEIVLIGIRQEESKRRQNLINHKGNLFFSKTNKILQYYPISELKVDDVFAYIYSNQLDNLLHPAYAKTRFVKDPAKIRISWFIDPTSSTFGHFCWLKYYYKEIYTRLVKEFPEIKSYT